MLLADFREGACTHDFWDSPPIALTLQSFAPPHDWSPIIEPEPHIAREFPAFTPNVAKGIASLPPLPHAAREHFREFEGN